MSIKGYLDRVQEMCAFPHEKQGVGHCLVVGKTVETAIIPRRNVNNSVVEFASLSPTVAKLSTNFC
jgi:hypothetical protein